jgi:hypothetical protein
MVAKINSIRASKGLTPLTVSAELTGIARNWTDRMVANGGLSHNPNYSSQVSANWRKLGENVGMGSDADTVMNAFLNSSVHYKNITDPAYNYIGVGVSYDATGQLYTTHDFMAADDGPPPSNDPPPAPAPRKRSAPPPDESPPPDPVPADPPPVELPPPAPAAPMRISTILAALRSVGT